MADEELKTERVHVLMTPSELKAIDDWMFARRIRSRGEAIRRLTALGQVTDLSLKNYFTAAKALLASLNGSYGPEDESKVMDRMRELDDKVLELSTLAVEADIQLPELRSMAESIARRPWNQTPKEPAPEHD
jgi:hypothetical protein